MMAPRLAGLARLARPLVERVPSSSRRVSLDYRARRFVRAAHLPPLERHHGWKEIVAPAVRAQLLAPLHDGRMPRDPVDRLRARYAETAGAPPLARLQDVDLAPYLADDLLTKTDRMSMAHSVEVRVPFLDPVVAELALALPTSAKVRGLAKKRLLRAVAATLLPREVARGAKRGFSIPMAAWLRGDLLPMARDLLAPTALERGGVLDPAPVSRLLEEHVARRDDHSRALWGLLCFVLWQQRAPVRILLVTQMWPGPRDPDLGAFVAAIAREFGARSRGGCVAIDQRGGGRGKYARRASRRSPPPGADARTSSSRTSSSLPARPVPRPRPRRGAARRHGARHGRRERSPVTRAGRCHARGDAPRRR